MKPDFLEQLNKIQRWQSSIKKFDVLDVKVINSKFGNKEEKLHVKLKEAIVYMNTLINDRTAGRDEVRALIGYIQELNIYNDNEKKKLESFWIDCSVMVKESMNYALLLEKENKELIMKNNNLERESNIAKGELAGYMKQVEVLKQQPETEEETEPEPETNKKALYPMEEQPELEKKKKKMVVVDSRTG